MTVAHDSTLARLIRDVAGATTAERLFAQTRVDDALMTGRGEEVSRGTFAMALNMLLLDDLMARVPTGAGYVAGRVAQGSPILFDHGAMRTIRFAEGPTGALPAGIDAIARVLEPLGYAIAGLYPLPALRMTGRAFVHQDLPETIPQFFVSELHVDQFDGAFQAAAIRVFGPSTDPLDAGARAVLDLFAAGQTVSLAQAAAALPRLVAVFGRHHPDPAVSDYETLLAQSGEAAWIATEGNAFNHATDRVPDVEALADRLRTEGAPMKDKVEISASKRVRQTAFRADPVERRFIDAEGRTVTRTVPGSFYEFISRDVDPATGTLDLRFDSGNATGIFAMTKAA